MKAPLCPRCETHHWSTQRCPADGRESSGLKAKPPSTSAVPAVTGGMDSQGRPVATTASTRGSVKSQTVADEPPPSVPPVATSTSDGPTTTSEDAASKRKTVDHRPQPVGDIAAEGPEVVSGNQDVGDDSLEMTQARNSLTPAEKQKAYRERHPEEVRQRDRERKARKRGGDG